MFPIWIHLGMRNPLPVTVANKIPQKYRKIIIICKCILVFLKPASSQKNKRLWPKWRSLGKASAKMSKPTGKPHIKKKEREARISSDPLFSAKYTLQEINISHLGKRKIIFKMHFSGDMLVCWRVFFRIMTFAMSGLCIIVLKILRFSE